MDHYWKISLGLSVQFLHPKDPSGLVDPLRVCEDYPQIVPYGAERAFYKEEHRICGLVESQPQTYFLYEPSPDSPIALPFSAIHAPHEDEGSLGTGAMK